MGAKALNLVTLHDGRQVDSMGRDWQIECLARYVLEKPLAERREFLAGMDKRQPKAADQVRDVMVKLHAAKKRAA